MYKKLILIIVLFPTLSLGQNIKFPPTPNENKIDGRNDNCYLSAIGHPTDQEKSEFINLLKPYVDSICPTLNLPKKTIMAMLILESGFGFTRTGYFANNLGGVKKWTKDTIGVYVLKGQPDENNGKNKILEKTKRGQLIFDELKRADNRYRIFSTKQHFVLYLTSQLLQNKNYKQYSINYYNNIKKGISEEEASLIYAYEIAEYGKYFHLGGYIYRNKIDKIINQYKL